MKHNRGLLGELRESALAKGLNRLSATRSNYNIKQSPIAMDSSSVVQSLMRYGQGRKSKLGRIPRTDGSEKQSSSPRKRGSGLPTHFRAEGSLSKFLGFSYLDPSDKAVPGTCANGIGIVDGAKRTHIKIRRPQDRVGKNLVRLSRCNLNTFCDSEHFEITHEADYFIDDINIDDGTVKTLLIFALEAIMLKSSISVCLKLESGCYYAVSPVPSFDSCFDMLF